MKDLIIFAVIALIALAVTATLIRRSGRKGCCGSAGDYTSKKKKKLANIIDTRVFTVEQMHCEKCASRVAEVVNDIPGLAGAVDLKAGTVTVSYQQDFPDEQLIHRLTRAGYPAARRS